jgi:hypothetical protein
MSQCRRRILRPSLTPADNGRRQALLMSRRTKLQAEQQCLARWMSRLRRAFHAVERSQQKVTRLEREIARLQES